MQCEYCGRTLRQGDTVHGNKYGSLTSNGFVPAKASAVTVICGPCGTKLYGFIFASLDQDKPSYSARYQVYEEHTTCLKNGYKLIQVISKLPASDLSALNRIINLCKEIN